MKKITKSSIAFICMLFFISVLFNQGLAQTSQKSNDAAKPIPADVQKAFEKSCIKCHSDHGNFMAESKVNLSKWADYSAEKQASKAKAMCKEVSEGDMPPKKFRKKNPENVPTPEDIKTICDWAQSLQISK